jgi:glutamyl-tRNA synthetase
VFRIEDTDASRATEDSMRSMIEALRWVGLDWDEGPEVGGAYGPYRQSERGELYAAVARRLEEAGHAYRDYRTKEELEAWREQTRGGDGPPVVKAADFEHTLEEVEAYIDEGRAASLRLRTPAHGEVVVEDLVRGQVRWDWDQVSDPVVQRSDGTATYPLANCCDDLAQGITLICRGEDLLSVTPRQVLLYQLLLDDGILDAALDEVGCRPAIPRGARRRASPTCRWWWAWTARSSPSATGPSRCRSSRARASCPAPCATTWRCWGGPPRTTGSDSPTRS